ncbi:MAG: tetratricopeptide repeat protein, partial [Pseudomonadota bacterium]|nr:tetratricopeptide repeat protein [Pseudomonadota bacterium]
MTEALKAQAIELVKRKKFAEAEGPCRALLAAEPNDPYHPVNLAMVLNRLNRFAEAEALCRPVLARVPDFPPALERLANLLRVTGRLEEAEATYKRLIARVPTRADAWDGLALTYQGMGRYGDAFKAFGKAISLEPNKPDYKANAGMCHVLVGEFAKGLPLYEHRKRMDFFPKRKFTAPEWDGGPLKGALLVHGEQGFGDQMQMARFLGPLHARGIKVILECRPELVRLFKTCPYVQTVIARGTKPPPYAVHAWMLS